MRKRKEERAKPKTSDMLLQRQKANQEAKYDTTEETCTAACNVFGGVIIKCAQMIFLVNAYSKMGALFDVRLHLSM